MQRDHGFSMTMHANARSYFKMKHTHQPTICSHIYEAIGVYVDKTIFLLTVPLISVPPQMPCLQCDLHGYFSGP